MANLEKYKEAARKFEAKEQWAKAIEQYSRAIEEMEGMPEIPEAELPLYNKVGDLCARVGDSQQAVSLYEHAIDKYHEIGLANNAIALCNKVIRLAPGRAQIYLKLGMLFASKGFGAEAKTNLLEYADRMQKAGQIEEAFKALKKFAEMTPGQDEIWSVLVQQARASARTPDQKEQVEKLLGEFEAKEKQSQARKSRMSRSQITGEALPPEKPVKRGELIFLDLDEPPAPTVPDFVKPLSVATLMDNPDVLVAYQMNGAPLPMLNGFPTRLVVPGWYATYWVKHLSEITVLDREFDGFWIKTAYRIPDTPCGCVEPGTKPARTVPIHRMNVRSFIVVPKSGTRVAAGHATTLKGISFDGGYGIAQVEVSSDGGGTWRRAELGEDLGRFSFREWSARWTPARPGNYRLMVRATNRVGESQPFDPLWNPAGYLRNVIERIEVTAE